MKKTLAAILCLALALSLLSITPILAEEASAGPVAYLMYADSAWGYQYSKILCKTATVYFEIKISANGVALGNNVVGGERGF